MAIRTLEDGFEYQAKCLFKEMEQDYKDEQEQRKGDGEEIQTFAEWLLKNTDELGSLFYDRFDQWCGMEESTEDLNAH